MKWQTATLLKCFIDAVTAVSTFSLFAAVDTESDDEAEQDGDDDGEHHDDDQGQWNLVLLWLYHRTVHDLTLKMGYTIDDKVFKESEIMQGGFDIILVDYRLGVLYDDHLPEGGVVGGEESDLPGEGLKDNCLSIGIRGDLWKQIYNL